MIATLARPVVMRGNMDKTASRDREDCSEMAITRLRRLLSLITELQTDNQHLALGIITHAAQLITVYHGDTISLFLAR